MKNCPIHFSRRKAIHGFTLIELLVVIAIVGVLAAILVPVLKSVRTNALRTESVSNLRQVYSAFVLYANGNQGLLPNSWIAPNEDIGRKMGSWAGQLTNGGYLGEPDSGQWGPSAYSVLGSPIQRREAAHFTVDKSPPRMSTYAMNELPTMLNKDDLSKHFKFGNYISPARTMLLSSGQSGDEQWFGVSVAPWKIPNFTDGIVELVYADGHVDTIPLESFPRQWGQRGSEDWFFWIGYDS